MPTVMINYDLCTSCDMCVDACTVRLLQFEEVDGEEIVKPRADRVEEVTQDGGTIIYDCGRACSNCRVCIITCPEEAIYVEPDEED